MSRDATEHEMIDRLVDATRQSADRVAEVCRSLKDGLPPSPRVLVRMRNLLRTASGCAHQLGHAQSNPAFFNIRDTLDALAGNAPDAAMSRSPQAAVALAMMGGILDKLWQEARRMATGRSVARADVLAMLDVRQKALVN